MRVSFSKINQRSEVPNFQSAANAPGHEILFAKPLTELFNRNVESICELSKKQTRSRRPRRPL
jgi:hypothetical protein